MKHNCWRDIGVWGDRTCPQLADEIHCHNCSVYSQVGRALLERAEPEGYTAEWTALIARTRDQTQASTGHTRLSMTIFRVGQEWLALPASTFHQVVAPSPVHALPHRHDALLRGIVNVRGQLLPCVSLHELLSIAVTAMAAPATNSTLAAVPSTASSAASSKVEFAPLKIGQQGGYPRLVVIRKSRETWAFEVDELYGLHACQAEELRNPPALSNKALASFTQSIFSWHSQNVSYLEAEHLFLALRQQAL